MHEPVLDDSVMKFIGKSESIGVCEGLVPPEDCQGFLDLYRAIKLVNGRGFDRSEGLNRKDTDVSIAHPSGIMLTSDITAYPCVSNFASLFWGVVYPAYTAKFAALNSYARHILGTLKVQRTLPSEGFHVWHAEDSSPHYDYRIGVVTLYLNDVTDGGETEFLYEQCRITPRAGTVAIFPAGFTHTHRGNPPLKGEKFIVTTWLEYAG